MSTLDLFDGRLTLLTGLRGRGWREAAAALPLQVLSFGSDLHDDDGQVAERYGFGDRGAALVRPDGYVAWRADGATDPARVLRAAVDRTLGWTAPVLAAAV